MANAYDIAKSVVGQYIDFDGAYGAQCLSKYHTVDMIDGSVKFVSELTEGDVLSNGNTVVHIKPVKKETYWMRTSQGWFNVSKDHRVFTQHTYATVESLEKYEELVLNHRANEKEIYHLTPDEFRLFGFWLGDGTISYRHKSKITPTVRIVVGSQRKHDYLSSLCVKLTKHLHSNKKAYEYNLVNKAHRDLMLLIKEFPDKCIRDVFTPQQYAYIIEGFTHADGTPKNNGHVLTNTNKKLLAVLQHGCHVNGWSAVMSKPLIREKTNLCDHPKPIWKLTVNKGRKPIAKFISLEESGEDTVYMLEVSGDNSYYSDNLKHHNCVDLILYISNRFGFSLMGNGNQIGAIGNVSAYADVYPYTPDFNFQRGDIISYDVPAHPYGHVVVYGSGNVDSMTIIEQNFSSSPVIEHTRSLRDASNILRVVRIKGQDNYTNDTGSSSGNSQDVGSSQGVSAVTLAYKVYEVTCDEVDAIVGNGNSTVVDTYYKCDKLIGEEDGNYIRIQRGIGNVAYIKKSCMELRENQSGVSVSSGGDKVTEETNSYSGGNHSDSEALYSLAEFLVKGVVNWGGYKYTYYSETVLPGGGLQIPGRHVNAYGYIADSDGYIVLAAPSSWGNVSGKTYPTPFGFTGKVYDVNAGGDSLDVYINSTKASSSKPS